MFLSNIPSYGELEGIGSFAFESSQLGEIISTLLPYIFVGAGLALLIYFILGGFKLLTSAGNPKSAAAGQRMLTNAVIGFLIVIGSYWLAQIFEIVFNVNILG